MSVWPTGVLFSISFSASPTVIVLQEGLAFCHVCLLLVSDCEYLDLEVKEGFFGLDDAI